MTTQDQHSRSFKKNKKQRPVHLNKFQINWLIIMVKKKKMTNQLVQEASTGFSGKMLKMWALRLWNNGKEGYTWGVRTNNTNVRQCMVTCSPLSLISDFV